MSPPDKPPFTTSTPVSERVSAYRDRLKDSKLKRVESLLPEEAYGRIAEVARHEGVPVSDAVAALTLFGLERYVDVTAAPDALARPGNFVTASASSSPAGLLFIRSKAFSAAAAAIPLSSSSDSSPIAAFLRTRKEQK